jgi:hypothetical protein
VWETDLELQEERLAEEQVQGLYSFNGRDLWVELEKLRERVAGVEDQHVAEAEQLSRSVREISNALVDLDMFYILDIPTQLRLAKDVLTAVSLILEHLQEKHASGASPLV